MHMSDAYVYGISGRSSFKEGGGGGGGGGGGREGESVKPQKIRIFEKG